METKFINYLWIIQKLSLPAWYRVESLFQESAVGCVIVFFFFFNPSAKKSVVKNRSQNFPLAVVETVMYHLPLWRFVIYVSVCSQGTCTYGDKCCYSHDPERTKEEKMEWFDQLFYFKIIFIFGLWMTECSLDEVRMTLQSDCNSTGTKTLTAVNLHNIIQFYPRAALFYCYFFLCWCFSPIKSSRWRYSRCFGRH